MSAVLVTGRTAAGRAHLVRCAVAGIRHTAPPPAFADRLAGLADEHKSAGRRRREELATLPCAVCGASPAQLLPRGRRCDDCRPAVPDPAASLPPASPARPAPSYGSATTDPLGRDGADWIKDRNTKLPRRRTATDDKAGR